ncbi:signal peptide peptidase SppA [Tenacibaculum xiamenense]|uniref:signal peptide peptidase SppA n=1 Tax=Tenacibaculum xiamenense TaxID=1261553 RepID=UPI003894D777
MKFLRNLLASILGFFIALFLIFILFVFIASVAGSSNEVVVKSNSILELDLSLKIKDYAPKDDNPLVNALGISSSALGLNNIIAAIENAKNDSKIEGISINTTFVNAGIAQVQAIRNKLEEFKESGKFVYAYNDFYEQKNYYLSSVADSVFVNPVGIIDFRGLSTEVLYYKDFEDKFGVRMEVIRHGKYKSAVEPYLSNEMSEANREQTTSFLKSIWSEMLEDISSNRGLSIEALNIAADSLKARTPQMALENKLIDGVIYQDEYEEKLESNIGVKPKFISIEDYVKAGNGKIKSSSKNKIAVIYAQGQIFYGEGTQDIIGQGLINKALRKAKKDKNVKAIVLRVNSPGGSALASELIWRELELLKKEKPVVVSMGNVAASGGYYIACNANKIIAEPTTITGSIGVFGVLPNASELAKKIGINAEQVSTNNSPNYSLFEPMDKRFYDVTKQGVEDTYQVFVDRVSAGRGMTFEQVDAIAQGRVWTGKEALANGLIDELGGLNDAVELAADLAEVDNYRVRNYPNYKKELKESLKISPFGKSSKEEILQELLGDEELRAYKAIKDFKNLKGIQARMPFLYDIK